MRVFFLLLVEKKKTLGSFWVLGKRKIGVITQNDLFVGLVEKIKK